MNEITLGISPKEKLQEIQAIIKSTNTAAPKVADLQALQAFLDRDARLVGEIGNVGKKAINAIITQAGESSAMWRECMTRQIEEMRECFGYGRSNLLEQILIDQVLLCWLRLNLLETLHYTKTTETHTAEDGLYWDKRLTAAQRRFTKACETLAKTKKMLASAHAKGAEAVKNLLQAEKEL